MVEFIVVEQTNHNDMTTVFKTLLEAATYMNTIKGATLYMTVKLS